MAPSLSLRGLIVVICSLAVLSLAQTLDTLFVKPTSDTPCDKEPCLTLMEYADNASQYFTRDTEAVFLSGQHLLEKNILIKNTVTFIMRKGINSSQSHPEIVCTAAVGIAFFNVAFVSITELSFAHCGIPTTVDKTWGLISYSVGLFVMANATVRMSHGSAVYTFNTTFYSLGNHIQDNTAGIEGGGMLAVSSNVRIENCYFYNNSATGFAGGAVSAYNSLIVFSGVNIFTDNKAEDGGGIFLSYSNVSFDGSNTFIHNSANREGGAILSEYSMIKFSGNTTFKNNFAISNHGTSALYVISSALITFTGATTFIGNGPSRDTLFLGNCPVKGCKFGAVYVHSSTVQFIGHTTFTGNGADTGSAIFAIEASVEFVGTQSFEHNVASVGGGAIFILNSTVNFTGCSSFINNSAGVYGGAIANGIGQLYITGNATFIGNQAPQGGGLYFEYTSQLFFTSPLELSFQYNSAVRGGAIYAQEASVEFVGTQSFEHNVASEWGGAIYMFNSTVNITGCSSFINNSAGLSGGAIANGRGQLYITGNATFIGNQAPYGGGLYFQYTSQLFLTSSLELSFQYNSAERGGAIYAQEAKVEFVGTQSFEYNVASEGGGAIYMFNSMVNITGCSSFINNSAGEYGGAIVNGNGQLYIIGNATFIDNQAPKGGGLYFEYISQLFLTSPLELSFQYNSAEKGGAIYVNDETNSIICYNDPVVTVSNPIRVCFVQFLSSDVKLDFVGNIATDKGQNVFGGMLNRCTANNLFPPEFGLSLLINTTNASTISSEPLRLCFCMNGKVNCAYDPPPFSIVRGATISVSAVAVDQVKHTVAAIIQSHYSYNNETVSDFGLGQRAQQIGTTCTTLNYTILTTASLVRFILYPEGPCRDIVKPQRQISVHLLPCPIAFELSGTQCICEKRLQPFTNSCNAESQTFSRSTSFWVGTEYLDVNYTGLILHPHCPLDYCISNYLADVSINDLDSQCSFNHSGILCGSCQQNLSLALGSSQCLPCSNYYLALLIPFAVAGVALVFILFMLRLTLSTGTLSGLIFYANIVAVNKEIFFPPQTTNILTVFIAWLNLDLGIETCFFNGMDTYARTWLQYAFPFYIWLLVSIIIVVSHYSVRVPKLLGRNPIAVLATLFLLSYAKLLRTIIASFSATVLYYPGNSTDTVWLYDGSIRFWKGKHIPLFLFSFVILLFLFLPYTLLLFLGQWLQALSSKKYLFWMNSLRMKTFLDAYHAPYNIKHRYWTGLMLLLRCVLFLVFASNTSGDPSVNLLAISSVALGFPVLTHVTGQVYSKWWLGILESSSILNLGITAAATHYVMQSGGSQSAVAYLSVSVAFTEFAVIIIYHAYLQLNDTGVWNSAQMWVQTSKHRESGEDGEPPTPPEEEVIPKPPSTTFIELREPLLDFPN